MGQWQNANALGLNPRPVVVMQVGVLSGLPSSSRPMGRRMAEDYGMMVRFHPAAPQWRGGRTTMHTPAKRVQLGLTPSLSSNHGLVAKSGRKHSAFNRKIRGFKFRPVLQHA